MQKDIPLIQGLVLVIGAMVVVINLLVDLLALALDPRTRAAAPGSSR